MRGSRIWKQYWLLNPYMVKFTYLRVRWSLTQFRTPYASLPAPKQNLYVICPFVFLSLPLVQQKLRQFQVSKILGNRNSMRKPCGQLSFKWLPDSTYLDFFFPTCPCLVPKPHATVSLLLSENDLGRCILPSYFINLGHVKYIISGYLKDEVMVWM